MFCQGRKQVRGRHSSGARSAWNDSTAEMYIKAYVDRASFDGFAPLEEVGTVGPVLRASTLLVEGLLFSLDRLLSLLVEPWRPLSISTKVDIRRLVYSSMTRL